MSLFHFFGNILIYLIQYALYVEIFFVVLTQLYIKILQLFNSKFKVVFVPTFLLLNIGNIVKFGTIHTSVKTLNYGKIVYVGRWWVSPYTGYPRRFEIRVIVGGNVRAISDSNIRFDKCVVWASDLRQGLMVPNVTDNNEMEVTYMHKHIVYIFVFFFYRDKRSARILNYFLIIN